MFASVIPGEAVGKVASVVSKESHENRREPNQGTWRSNTSREAALEGHVAELSLVMSVGRSEFSLCSFLEAEKVCALR